MLCLRKLHQPAQRSGGGFTLVELLVVLAVLAMLLAILMPLFQDARQMAYRVKCANNLRQLGTAFALYARDWDGWWPCPGGLVGDRSYWSQSGTGGLWPYVRQRGLDSVWCCPLLDQWHGQYPPRSYSMNSYLRTPCDAEYFTCTYFLRGINIAAICAPQDTILLYEGIPRSSEYQDRAYTEDDVAYVYRCANWTWAKGYYKDMPHAIDAGRPWHGRVNNYLYCDGHIVARPPGRKTTGVYSNYGEMRQWYVDKRYFARRYTKLAGN